jgi:hypothetical protein
MFFGSLAVQTPRRFVLFGIVDRFVRRELLTALSQWARKFRAQRDGSAVALVGSFNTMTVKFACGACPYA